MNENEEKFDEFEERVITDEEAAATLESTKPGWEGDKLTDDDLELIDELAEVEAEQDSKERPKTSQELRREVYHTHDPK